jgi:hypothetical protein
MDPYHVRFGPQHCAKCGQRHPSGFDCVADSAARVESMRRAVENAKVVRTPRPLLIKLTPGQSAALDAIARQAAMPIDGDTVIGRRRPNMSWSFYAAGKPATVATRADAELNTKRCEGAEEDARQNVLSAVKILCLEGAHSECAIKVEASGSAYTKDGLQISNQLKLSFETIDAS